MAELGLPPSQTNMHWSSPKPVDEATRKRNLRQFYFRRIYIYFFFSLLITLSNLYMGNLSFGVTVVYFIAGLLLTKPLLLLQQNPRSTAYRWTFFAVVMVCGVITDFLHQQTSRFPTFWQNILFGAYKRLGRAGSTGTATFLLLWLFREPFWLYVTKENHEKGTIQGNELALSPDYVPVNS